MGFRLLFKRQNILFYLLSLDKGGHNEAVLSKLCFPLIFYLVAHFLERCLMSRLMVLLSWLRLFISTFGRTTEITRLCISIKLPDINAIILRSANNLVLITRIEHNISNSISMPNKGLIEEWHSSVSLVVPGLNERIVSSSHHKSTIQ